MPYDAGGNHTPVSGYEARAGETIQPSQHNPPILDASQSFNQVHMRDGRTPATGDWNMNGFKLTGLADGTGAQDVATVGQAAAAIGDFKGSIRNLGVKWLRRNGGIYNIADYPDLAAQLPPLPDGITWSGLSPAVTGSIISIGIYAGEFYIASVSSGTTYISKSTDFSSWSLAATVAGIAVSRFYKFGSIFVIIGYDGSGNIKVASSTDGSTWTSPSAIGSMTGTFASMAHNGSIYVAVGNTGAIYTSPDLTTWTVRSSGTTQALNDIRWLNGSVFVAVGGTGTVVTSANGTAWTLRTTGVTKGLSRVTYGAGLYVAAGGDGTGSQIITSPDLATWTQRSAGTTEVLRGGLVYSTSGFLVLGDAGIARISTDGMTWTASPSGTSGQFFDAAFDPSNQNVYYAALTSGLRKGVRTLPTQFQVPSDDPTYGWIKALA